MGLIHDRDTVAFYGDPAWVARLDESHAKSPWHISWNDPEDAAKGFTVTANKDAKGRLGVWFPNRISTKTATVTVGDAATPVDKMGLLTNDFLLLRELELKKGGKSRRGNEMTEFPDMPKPGGKSASLPAGIPHARLFP